MKAIQFAPASKIIAPSHKTGSTQHPEIFVGGLSATMTAEELKKEMSVFGVISSTRILYYRDGRPRGFGFVSFEDYETTQVVVEKKFLSLSNCVVECKLAVSKTESKQLSEKAVLRKVHVEGLENQSEEQLQEYFAKFGPVSKVRFAQRKSEMKEISTDFSKATITFKDEESAKCCIDHCCIHQIMGTVVSVSAASTSINTIGNQRISEAGTHYSASSSSRDIQKNSNNKEESSTENLSSPSKISNAMREVLSSAYKHYTSAPSNIQFRFHRQTTKTYSAAKSFRQLHREIQAAFMFDSR